MFALLLVPFAALLTAENQDFLAKVTEAPWHYVGVQERRPGPQTDGAETAPLRVGDYSYILFKQMPAPDGSADMKQMVAR